MAEEHSRRELDIPEVPENKAPESLPPIRQRCMSP